MNTKKLHHPHEFPIQIRYEENGWNETVYELRYYTESQVGEMLLGLFGVISAQNNNPCDKGIHALSESWLQAAENMVKGENNGTEKIP